MKLRPLPALADNYIWMLHDGHEALVVDPGDPTIVVQALESEGVQLQGILVTHHHGDHVAGVKALHDHTQAPVFGPAQEPVPEPYTPVSHGQHIRVLGLDISVLDVPGHTAGHVAFFCQPHGEDPVLFCGDTLFSAGCGRLFEGTPEQMQTSLALLMTLPDATRVCCAHEYTESNLRFAAAVEPHNRDITAHALTCRARLQQGLATLPSTLGRERQINPFVRTDQPSVVAAVRHHDPVGVERHGVFATLRQWKNQYS